MTAVLRGKLNQRGLTARELVMLVAIAAILIALLVPGAQTALREWQYRVNRANVESVKNRAATYILQRLYEDKELTAGGDEGKCWYAIARVDKRKNISELEAYVSTKPADMSASLLKAEGDYARSAPMTPEEFLMRADVARDGERPSERNRFKTMKPEYWVLVWLEEV